MTDSARPSPAGSAPAAATGLLHSGRARFSYLTYRSLSAALGRLPGPAADMAAMTVADVLGRLPASGGAMYARHLRRILGREVGRVETRKWVRRAYRSYARYWLEGARLGNVPPAVIDSRMTIASGWEAFTAAMASGNGVVLALPHIGSWEWGGAWLAQKGYPMTSVAEALEPPELYEYFVRVREQLGLKIVPLGAEAGGVLLRTLREGGLVGLLCDRDIQGNGIEVEFFGERTTLPGGPATLALRTGATLMAGALYSGPGSGHTGVFMPPISTERTGSLRADVARLTQAIARDLEVLIRRAPEQWHVFQPNWPSDPGYRGRLRG